LTTTPPNIVTRYTILGKLWPHYSARSSRISTKTIQAEAVDHGGICGIGKRWATRQDLTFRMPGSGPPAGPKSEMATTRAQATTGVLVEDQILISDAAPLHHLKLLANLRVKGMRDAKAL
jgi:hypothetical protein